MNYCESDRIQGFVDNEFKEQERVFCYALRNTETGLYIDHCCSGEYPETYSDFGHDMTLYERKDHAQFWLECFSPKHKLEIVKICMEVDE